VDRAAGERGYCGAPDDFLIARVAKHPWEEPSISGKNGSGTVFFGGCNLRCVYCQNRVICGGEVGKRYSPEELLEAMLSLVSEGAHNVNLVTPTPYADRLVPVLRRFKERSDAPIVYNCGGYESVESLRLLEGLVDVYLPDCKYLEAETAEKYSRAADYYPVAEAAIAEMLRQVGKPRFDGEGMLRRGVILRHLVLPGGRRESIALLQRLHARFGSEAFLLSLMSQYTPAFASDAPYPELHRRVTSFEYRTVAEAAEGLGFDGYFQERSSATETYTPTF
jgi:putative pyruvate formate lyase activating enzyme